MAQKLSNKKIISSVKQRKAQKKRIIWVLSILVVIACVYGIYGNLFRINDVEIKGNIHTDTSDIQAVADTALHERRWFVFPQDHIVFFPTTRFSRELVERIPGIVSAEADVSMRGLLSIHVQDRKPLGIWCNGVDDAECFFFDQNGVVFKPSFAFTGSVFAMWRKEGVVVNLGQVVPCVALCANAEYARFLADHKIATVVMNEESHTLASVDGYNIKAGDNATTTMNHIRMLGVKKVDIQGLEYVDVRFPHKIYYK